MSIAGLPHERIITVPAIQVSGCEWKISFIVDSGTGIVSKTSRQLGDAIADTCPENPRERIYY